MNLYKWTFEIANNPHEATAIANNLEEAQGLVIQEASAIIRHVVAEAVAHNQPMVWNAPTAFIRTQGIPVI